MGGVWRHIKRDNRVLRAELIEFGATVAAVPVKDQESILADRTRLGMLVKHLFEPEQAQLIIGPSILINRDHCSGRQSLNLILESLVILALKNKHRWQALAASINPFNHSNLFSIPRLYKLRTKALFRPSNYFYGCNNPH
jgi:hypothetical protein